MTKNSNQNQRESDTLLRGAAQIGAEIGLEPGAAHYQLANGNIKSARRMGRIHVAGRKALRREFGLED